jgi:glycogen debranching enzyme
MNATGTESGAATVPRSITMEEAVGYDRVECAGGASVEGSLVLKHDRLYLLLDPAGNIAQPGHCGLGLFVDDTRTLSEYRLELAGGAPTVLSSQVIRAFTAQVDLAISDREFGGQAWDLANVVHIRRELVLDDRLAERVTVTNFHDREILLPVRLHLGCDFADIFEVRGWKREKRGTFYAPEITERAIRYAYRGRDGALIRSELRFTRAPDEIGGRGARWTLRLAPHAHSVLEWHVLPDSLLGEAAPGETRDDASMERRRTRLHAVYDGWRARCAEYRTSDEQFNLSLEQAVTDLRALYIGTEDGDIVSAGTPWYSTAFGRDSIITSLQTLVLNPAIARDTLRYLAATQGVEENAFTEEQPGRIMHELRRGELARTREIPHIPYYGTVDATPLFVILLHETWRWTGDQTLIRELLPNAERALAWIDRYGDVDGDGFVEYARTSPKGLVNQGWKDSWDGVPFPDGRIPEPPIALVEVQGYVYDAKRRMAALYEALGDPGSCARLLGEARALRERIVDRFWLDDLDTFALALDGEKRPIPTLTSNAGHLLWNRVPDATQAERMARRFMAPEMFSGWGLRTLSAAHPVYNPMSYHNGSVWPHDNALVALGLSFYGQVDAARRIFTAMHEAARGMRYNRLPELFCGMTRAGGLHPVLYPVSCSPQAWASGAPWMLLQSAIGILPDASHHMLHVRQPWLPEFLDELTVHRLRIGGSRVSMQFVRHGDRTLANLLAVEGAPLQVRIDLT